MDRTILHSVKRCVWRDPERYGPLRRDALRSLQILYCLGHDLAHGQLSLRAASLSYTTLLSLVPLLAVSFSVLQAFGVYNQLEPLLMQFLEPLGPNGTEIGERIVGFVSNMRVGVLGSLGLAMLFFTVVSLVNKIEKSFNQIWRVKENRSFARRFSDYLSVILIGPVLMFSAVGLSASLMSTTLVQHLLTIEPFGTALYTAGRVIPKLLFVLAFAFLYTFIPNTRVRVAAALGGALFASILWQLAGWGFASFVASSTKYAAIYSSFAILITFLIWLHLNWLIVLIGAQTAFYLHNPSCIKEHGAPGWLKGEQRERVALLIMARIVEPFCRGAAPPTTAEIVRDLKIPVDWAGELLETLEQGGLVVAAGRGPDSWLPARDPETISATEILRSVNLVGGFGVAPAVPAAAQVDDLLREKDRVVAQSLSQKNIKEIVFSGRYRGDAEV